MKRFKRIRRNQQLKGFLAKCPVSGGACLNPLCMLGCIEL